MTTTFYQLNLEPRAFDTVLAALRYWQRQGLGGPTDLTGLPEWDIADNHGQPLSYEEVDALCERMNTSGMSFIGEPQP